MNVRSGSSALECLGGRADVWKPPSSATSRGVSPSRSSSATCVGQQRVLGRVAGLVAAGMISPRAPRLGVLGHLADLRHVPELVGLAELALADRSGVRVEDRHEPIGDPLAAHPASGSARRPARARMMNCSSLLICRSFALAPRPRARRRATTHQPLGLADRALDAACPPARSTRAPAALRSPVRRPNVRDIARTRRPIARERSRT